MKWKFMLCLISRENKGHKVCQVQEEHLDFRWDWLLLKMNTRSLHSVTLSDNSFFSGRWGKSCAHWTLWTRGECWLDKPCHPLEDTKTHFIVFSFRIQTQQHNTYYAHMHHVPLPKCSFGAITLTCYGRLVFWQTDVSIVLKLFWKTSYWTHITRLVSKLLFSLLTPNKLNYKQ